MNYKDPTITEINGDSSIRFHLPVKTADEDRLKVDSIAETFNASLVHFYGTPDQDHKIAHYTVRTEEVDGFAAAVKRELTHN